MMPGLISSKNRSWRSGLIASLSLALAACAFTPLDRQYQSLIVNWTQQKAAYDPAAAAHALWRSENLNGRINAQNKLLDKVEALAHDSSSCAERLPLIQQALQLNYSSLMAHYLAAQCANIAGNQTLASQHETINAATLEFMLKEGQGDSVDRPIHLIALRDADSFIRLGGYRALSSHFQFNDFRDDLQYVVLVNDGEGHQSALYFDATEFLVGYFAAAYKGQNYSDKTGVGVRAMADSGDDAAQVTVGDEIWSYRGRDEEQRAIEFYRKAAAQGNLYAKLRMAARYRLGRGVSKDSDAAVRELTDAAEHGSAQAEIYLAQMYDAGLGGVPADAAARDALLQSAAAKLGRAEVEYELALKYMSSDESLKNEKKALQWMQMAAEKKLPRALNTLGWMYETGSGDSKDVKKAQQYYEQAAALGNGMAMTNLAQGYRYGTFGEKDQKQVLNWLQKAEQADDGKGTYLLAERYYFGEGLTKDLARAKQLAEKSARLNYGEAMCRVAYLEANPKQGRANGARAMQWLRRGAIRNEGWCAYNLGWEYEKGRFVLRDYKQALFWYLLSAETEYSSAYAAVAWLYEHGMGVEINMPKAIEYLQKGVAAGDERAQTNLASLYLDGKGVAQDYAQAFKLYQSAATQKESVAQRMLGRLYRDGKGVAKDLEQARHWLQLSADQGDPLAAQDLAGLAAYK